MIFLFFLIGAFLYLRYTPKMYKTNSTLQINIKDQPDEFLNIYSYNQQTNINSEVELMKSQKILNNCIENLNIKLQYYSEGDILTRDLYSRSPFEFEQFELKDSNLISEKLYVTFENNYFSITNEDKKLVYASFIQENKFFSNDNFSGKLNVLSNNESFEKSLESHKYYFIVPQKIN